MAWLDVVNVYTSRHHRHRHRPREKIRKNSTSIFEVRLTTILPLALVAAALDDLAGANVSWLWAGFAAAFFFAGAFLGAGWLPEERKINKMEAKEVNKPKHSSSIGSLRRFGRFLLLFVIIVQLDNLLRVALQRHRN